MYRMRSLLLALAIVVAATLHANASPQLHEGKGHVVRFEVINMSGAARELHYRGGTVSLPVAMRISLQMQAGDLMKITSATDRKVTHALVVTQRDEGRTIPLR
jgi:hypothetical protein